MPKVIVLKVNTSTNLSSIKIPLPKIWEILANYHFSFELIHLEELFCWILSLKFNFSIKFWSNFKQQSLKFTS